MSGSLRIVHLLAPGAYGGTESVVRMLAQGLAHRGHGVHVGLTLGPDAHEHPLEERLEHAGVKVRAWRLHPRAYVREARAMRALCGDVRPDVVHTHGYRADVVGGLALRGRVPIVTTVHGFTGGGSKNRLYEWLQRRVYRRFESVIAVSRAMVEELVEGGVPSERARLLPNAAPPAEPQLPRGEARRTLGLPEEGWIVGWVGRLSREKGADVLLDATRRLTDLPLQFALVGEGSEGPSLRAAADRLDGSDRLHWVGGVRDAARLFRAFDLFVLSSRTEGTPIVLFEAIQADVPVVATRVGGVSDVVGEAGAWLVEPSSPHDLAAAIRASYEDAEDRRRRAAAARQRIERIFGQDQWLQGHERVYRAAARRGGSL